MIDFEGEGGWVGWVGRRSSPFSTIPVPSPFAHRGGAAGGLENSLAAFAQAVELGYRYLETDVHATSDGVLLAFHDRTLDRVTDRVGVVAQLPWREVREARIGGREPIPTLEELLGSWPDIRVNIDVKEIECGRATDRGHPAHRGGGPGVRGLLLGAQDWLPYVDGSARASARRWRRPTSGCSASPPWSRSPLPWFQRGRPVPRCPPASDCSGS